MSIDTQLRRHFRLLVGLMVAAAAYFQAAGLTSLVRIRLAEGSALGPVNRPVPSSTALPRAPRAADLAETTERLFDSTRPAARPVPAPANVQGDPSLRNPFDDPTCDFAWVVLIAAVDEPSQSLVVVRQKNGRGEVRRLGDEVGSYTVWHIAPHRVWLTSSLARCQMRLGEAPRVKEPARPSSRSARAPRTRRGRRR